MTYTAFKNDNNNEPKRHYNVRIMKLQPTKVLINGRIRDRASLTPEEHRAVRIQEQIDKAKRLLQQQSELKRREQ